MRLTEKEKQICKKYSKTGRDRLVHCHECPLAVDHYAALCYANIDGRTKEARALKRY